MKIFILLFVLLLLRITAHAQAPEGTSILCRGVSIPEGYTIIKETKSPDCPNGAYLIKKSSAGPTSRSPARLSQEQRKEAGELLLLIDVMETRLKSTWNNENDFGVRTDEDFSYLKGAANAVQAIVTGLDKLPDGKYKAYLGGAAIAYADVARIRVAAGEDGGEERQLQIVKRYELEDTEPHLWAWRIWQVARLARNAAAKELGLPVRDYEEDK